MLQNDLKIITTKKKHLYQLCQNLLENWENPSKNQYEPAVVEQGHPDVTVPDRPEEFCMSPPQLWSPAQT